MESDRVRAVTDFARDIAVDASAGTGKTATLIARVTNLFLAKRELLPDQVLMLTFTEKAAAEMKARVQSLRRPGAMPPSRRKSLACVPPAKSSSNCCRAKAFRKVRAARAVSSPAAANG